MLFQQKPVPMRLAPTVQEPPEELLSHVAVLSGTMCLGRGGWMLIAETGGLQVQPALLYKHYDVKIWPQMPKRVRSQIPLWVHPNTNTGLYRSWVPDEDLGAAVGVLLCGNLQVGHQHLHSLPVGVEENPRWSPKVHATPEQKEGTPQQRAAKQMKSFEKKHKHMKRSQRWKI